MENANYRPVTTGEWMLTYLLMCVPIVNFILLFVWAFGSNTPVSKSNWAKASLIWGVIGIAIYVFIFVVFGAAIFAAAAAGQ